MVHTHLHELSLKALISIANLHCKIANPAKPLTLSSLITLMVYDVVVDVDTLYIQKKKIYFRVWFAMNAEKEFTAEVRVIII
jgi:hypothetical protein